MKRSAMLMALGAAALMGNAGAIHVEDLSEEARKTPPTGPKPPRLPAANLPGETNRQFAARIAKEAD